MKTGIKFKKDLICFLADNTDIDREKFRDDLLLIADIYGFDNDTYVLDVIFNLSIISKKSFSYCVKEVTRGLISASYCDGLDIIQCAGIIFVLLEESDLLGDKAGYFCKLLCSRISGNESILYKFMIDASSTYSIINELSCMFNMFKADNDNIRRTCLDNKMAGIRYANIFDIFMSNFERYTTLVNAVNLDDNIF